MARWPILAAGAIYRTSTPELVPVGLEFERLTRSNLTMLPEGQEYALGDLIRITGAANADADLQLETLPIGTPDQQLMVNADGDDVVWSTVRLLNGVNHNDTVDVPVVAGDLISGNVTPRWDVLPIGTPGQVLGISVGLPTWQTPSTYLAHDLLSATHSDTAAAPVTEGDLIVGDGIGPANWQVLLAGAPAAILWVNPIGGGGGGPVPQWAVNLAYNDTTRFTDYTGGTHTFTASTLVYRPTVNLDVEIGGFLITRHGSNTWDLGRSGRRFAQFSQTDSTGRMGIELWPDDFTITTATGTLSAFFTSAARTITTNIPAGGGVGNDQAVAGMNFAHTMRFEDLGNLFASQLLINAGVQIECAANVGPIYLFLDQYRTYADGGVFTCSQHNAMRAQPNWGPNINAGSLTQTSAELYFATASVDGTVGSTSVTTLTYFAAKSPSLVGGGVIGTLNVLDIVNITGPGIIRGINSAMSSGTFINHTGSAPSLFSGTVRMSDGISTLYGTTTGVGLSRQGASLLRMQGFGATFNEGLDFQMEGSNNIRITSSTGASLNINTIEFAFGPGVTADGTNNWVMAFAPGLRATQLAGDYSEVLFTSSTAITIAHAITTFATWTVNAPTIVIGAGSILNAANVLIQTNMNVGTNRYGLLITSNPTGGTLNYPLRVVSGIASFNDAEVRGTLIVGAASAATPNSVLETAGSFAAEIDTISGATTLTDQHHTVLCDAVGGTFTVTLPAVAGVTRRIYVIKKIDASGNFVTIDANGAETIDGAATFDLELEDEVVVVQSDGVAWFVTS